MATDTNPCSNIAQVISPEDKNETHDAVCIESKINEDVDCANGSPSTSARTPLSTPGIAVYHPSEHSFSIQNILSLADGKW
jgi:hypothetical protein